MDLGKEFLIWDNEVTDNEVQRLTDYLNMMMVYAEREFFNKGGANVAIDYAIQNEDFSNVVEVEDSLEELLEQLNSLIGLESVKKDVTSLINLLQIRNTNVPSSCFFRKSWNW